MSAVQWAGYFAEQENAVGVTPLGIESQEDSKVAAFSHAGVQGGIIANRGRNAMSFCDLCGQAKECLKKEIDGREYDICADCWNALAEKLKGKGRVKKERETVFLPPLKKEPEPPELKRLPGEPPKIWGRGWPQ